MYVFLCVNIFTDVHAILVLITAILEPLAWNTHILVSKGDYPIKATRADSRADIEQSKPKISGCASYMKVKHNHVN